MAAACIRADLLAWLAAAAPPDHSERVAIPVTVRIWLHCICFLFGVQTDSVETRERRSIGTSHLLTSATNGYLLGAQKARAT
jgi:hypothetical protein